MNNILVPEQGKLGFLWSRRVLGPDGLPLGDWKHQHNLLPIEMLQHVMMVVFKAGTQVPTWYLAPYEGNYTPVPTEIGATFAASTTETTAYQETTRQAWACGNPVAGALDNTANMATYTNFSAAKTIYGGGLLSTSVKGGNTGVLASLVRFASPDQVPAGGTYQLVAALALASA